MFRPKPRVKSLTELNAWLEDQCIAYAQRTKHPEFKDRTVWDVFQEERASLMELRGPFDWFVEKAVRASTTCLIMADHNRYSVDARAAGRMVLVRSHAERIVVLLGDEAVADHTRHFRRDQIIYDPWHYLPVLMKKPGALRNGAPFKDWALPPALTRFAPSGSNTPTEERTRPIQCARYITVAHYRRRESAGFSVGFPARSGSATSCTHRMKWFRSSGGSGASKAVCSRAAPATILSSTAVPAGASSTSAERPSLPLLRLVISARLAIRLIISPSVLRSTRM
jgi:hypothetical protein